MGIKVTLESLDSQVSTGIRLCKQIFRKKEHAIDIEMRNESTKQKQLLSFMKAI